jgi:hypothetical protein
LSGKSLGHQRAELGDSRMQGELVVGGVKESFDGFGFEVPMNSSASRENRRSGVDN